MRSLIPWLCLVVVVPSSSRALPDAGTVVHSIALPPEVNYAVGVTALASELLVANLREGGVSGSLDAVYRLDPCTGSLRGVLTQGRVLQQLDTDGTSVCAIRLYRTLERLGPTGAALQTQSLPTGVMLTGLAAVRGTDTSWQLNGFSSTVIELRTNDAGVVRSINTSASHTGWSGLAYDGCSLWTSDVVTDELVRIDPSSGLELQRLATPAGFLGQVEGLHWDGAHLAISDQKRNRIDFLEVGPAVFSDGGVCSPPRSAAVVALCTGAVVEVDGGAPTGGGAGGTGGGGGGGGPSGGGGVT